MILFFGIFVKERMPVAGMRNVCGTAGGVLTRRRANGWRGADKTAREWLAMNMIRQVPECSERVMSGAADDERSRPVSVAAISAVNRSYLWGYGGKMEILSFGNVVCMII